MKKKVISAGVIAIVAIVLGIAFLKKPTTPIRSIPNPNGYSDFVGAGNGADIVFESDLSLEELQTYIKTNQVRLDLIRAGLNKECVVSFSYNPAGFKAHVTDVMAIKANAHLLIAEGRLAEQEARSEDAAKIYLELIEYGCISGKGGVYIDKLVSRACEIMGMSAMTNIMSKLQDREFCQNAIESLKKLNSERESLEAADANERSWDWQQGLQIKDRIDDLLSGKSRRIRNGFRKQMLELPVKSNQLLVIFAARIFELDHGRQPNGFSELVPAYLKSIPVDAITGKEIPFSLNLTKHTNELLF